MSQVWNHWQKNTFRRKKRPQDTDQEDEPDATEPLAGGDDGAARRAFDKKPKRKFAAPLVTHTASRTSAATTESASEAGPRTLEHYAIPLDFSSAADLFCSEAERQHAKDSRARGAPARGGVPESPGSELDAAVRSILEAHRDLSESHVKQILACQLPADHLNVREEDIAGLQDVKRLIKNKVMRPLLRPEVHRGLYQPSSGILFFGPPGTGKTTLAKWIASESQAAFFCITPSTLTSKFYGESETLVSALFAVAARLAPSIIFIDEIDSLLSKRNEKEEESTTRMKNQLLTMMDGLNTPDDKFIVVIGATNRPEALDDAGMRRLSKRVYIPLPDAESIAQQIRAILKHHAQSMDIPFVDDLEWVAAYAQKLVGFNGSDIRNLCMKAAEVVYESVIEGIEGDINMLSQSAFWLPGEQDFELAYHSIAPLVSNLPHSAEKWAQQYSRFSSD